MQDRNQDIGQALSTEATEPAKPKLSLLALWNMNLGFLGIQFGWGLQMANMSVIFENLGASAHQLPILWIAAPVTGLIVQPIIGNLSDHTWGPLGRRRPYFLGGAIVAAFALVLMPHAASLWMAAGLLWLLDTGTNVGMEPFRAFVGDILPKEQRTKGFALQSLAIGLGAILASALPWILRHGFAIGSSNPLRRIPLTIELAFYVGAALVIGTVVITVVTTQERPPRNFQVFERLQEERGGLLGSFRETGRALQNMPAIMQQLAWVQFFTWSGIFCFFIYFPPAVARNIFGAIERGSDAYEAGVEWAGICFSVFNGVCVAFSFLIPFLVRRMSRKLVHSLCLLCGGLSLISLVFVQNQYVLLLAMVGFGLAWASVLAIPYAMLVGEIPSQQRGIYMGIFNFFIVIPEILISLCFGWVMQNWLHDDRLLAVIIGGSFLTLAAVLTLFLKVKPIGAIANTIDPVDRNLPEQSKVTS